MIIVAKSLEKRLDNAWYRLQNAICEKHPNGISQNDCDEACVKMLEQLVMIASCSSKELDRVFDE